MPGAGDAGEKVVFSLEEKKLIAAKVEEVILSLRHPEMPSERPRFTLRVDGKEGWSWAVILPNWTFDEPGAEPPGVNPWNERKR